MIVVPHHIRMVCLEVIQEPQKQGRVPAAAFNVEDVQGLVLLLRLTRLVFRRMHTAGILRC